MSNLPESEMKVFFIYKRPTDTIRRERLLEATHRKKYMKHAANSVKPHRKPQNGLDSGFRVKEQLFGENQV